MRKKENFLGSIIFIWSHLTNKRKNQTFFLLFVMILAGSFELFTISLVMPFLYLLQNVDKNNGVPLGNLPGFNFLVNTNNIYFVSALFITVIVILGFLRLFVLWYGGALTARVGSDIGSKAYRVVLNQPYEFHLKNNSSNLIGTINGHTEECIGGLIALLQLSSALIIILFILIGLLLINPFGAILSILTIASLYFLIGYWSRTSLRNNSLKVSDARNQQMRALQEGFGGIREIILDYSQFEYYKLFKQSSYVLRIKTAFNQFLASFPRYSIETLGLLLITTLGIVIINSESLGEYSIPILGTIALAGQRLLPTMQQIYNGWANLRAAMISFESLSEILELKEDISASSILNFKLKKNIEFRSVSFEYEESNSRKVFTNLNFTIDAGTSLGILGPSGGGKTTFVNLIMGLLIPTEGDIFVDGKRLQPSKKNQIIRKWRSTIAHVPQHIYLTDNTIKSNITFGLTRDKIDEDLLREAAFKANLLDFILSLPNGFETLVGERGIRLSGGQRQRIGIARALYKKASVMILDEATSALDNQNEESVIKAIENISKDITLIMVAHRVSTLRRCQKIISIDNGKISTVDRKKIF